MQLNKTEESSGTALTSEARAVRAAELAADKKGYDIKIRNISAISSIADYLVIISGSSDRHLQAIADSIRRGLKKYGKVNDIEGEREGKWIVMDYGDVLVHIFHEPLRGYYDLDGLWKMAPELPLSSEIASLRSGGGF